jgi:hypothetical protein
MFGFRRLLSGCLSAAAGSLVCPNVWQNKRRRQPEKGRAAVFRLLGKGFAPNAGHWQTGGDSRRNTCFQAA